MRPLTRLLCGLLAGLAWATAAAQPVPAAPPAAPPIRLPDLDQLKAPPQVRAATSALGLGRQRLALVIAQSRVAGVPLPAAPRDARAVAVALEKAGYVVMPRPDLGPDALRAALKEFRARLTPRGAGLIYVVGAGAQLDGQGLLLTRELDPARAADPAALRAAGVPLSELVEALQITPSSLRLLVVDAAAPVPGLPPAARGLAAPALPEGVMALLSANPGAEVALRDPAPLPNPAPADPRDLAGSPFGTALVHALVEPGATGPDVLRNARRLTMDGTLGRQAPWIGGTTDEQDEAGEPGLVQTLLPVAPGEAALKAVRRMAGLGDDARARASAEAPRTLPAPPEPAPPPASPSPAAVATGVAVAAEVAAQVLGAAAAKELATVAAAQAAVEAATAAGSALAGAGPLAARREGGKPVVDSLGERRDEEGQPPTSGPPPSAAAAPAAASTAPPATPPPPPAPAPSPTTAPAPALPPALPKLNPYGYAAGDSFTYRRIDQWKGEIVGTVVQLIEQVLPDGEMLAQENQGTQALDAQGRVRSRSGPWGRSEFQPVEEFHWSRPRRGESRDVAFTEHFQRRDMRGERRWEGEVEVGRPTRIQTPAGSFDVLPMEGEGWYTEINALGGRRSVMWERTVWYSPDLGHPVAIDIVERDASSRLLRKERLELLHVQTSRTVGP